jgi:hypothetical protein
MSTNIPAEPKQFEIHQKRVRCPVALPNKGPKTAKKNKRAMSCGEQLIVCQLEQRLGD